MKTNFMANNGRLQAMLHNWDKVLEELFYLERRKTKKDKDKENKITFPKMVKFVPEDIKMECLRLYLQACKYQHALAFFQWRKTFVESSNK